MIKLDWKDIWNRFDNWHETSQISEDWNEQKKCIRRTVNKQLKDKQKNQTQLNYSTVYRFVEIWESSGCIPEVCERLNEEFGWTIDRREINRVSWALRQLGLTLKSYDPNAGKKWNQQIRLGDDL